jgi:hypothetical protein
MNIPTWLLLMMFSLSAGALSQVDTGVITGEIHDHSGALVPNAKVSIQNQDTGIQQDTVTNAAGIYVSPPLRPGQYKVEVSLAGFRTAAKSVPLEVAQRAVVDFSLALGSVSEAILVQAVAPLLQTEDSTLSNFRSEKSIKDLPLNGRNFAQLIGLSAGAMPAQTQQSGSPITMKRGVTGYAVNGQRLEDNNFLVDGLNNNENHNGLGILIFPPLDAIQEFRVESSVANAQYGHGGGGTINLTYKSGSKDFHGDLFEFLRNSSLDAKNFFDSPAAPIPPFKQNQFGGTLGGPLFPWRKNPKTFFFADYEGQRVRQAQTLISSVPAASFRTGDFSAAPQRIYDPLTQTQSGSTFTRQQFAGNRIPASRLDPVGQNIVSLYPLPNLGAGISNNFLFNPVRRINADSFDVKIDHQFSEADTIFVRFSQGLNDLLEPSQLPAPAVGNGPGVPGPTSQPVRQTVAAETHVFSPTRVNEARFGFSRLNLQSFNLNYGKDVSSQIGVPGANLPSDRLTSGLTIFSVTGFQALGDNGFSPAIIVSQNSEANDTFTWVTGRHTLKFGGSVLRRDYNAFQSDTLHGTMSFTTAYSSNPAAPQGTGIGAADVLLGKPVSGSIRYLTGTRGFRRSELGLFIQDDVKISARLTLNAGLRYENCFGCPWNEVNNRQYQFLPATGSLARAGSTGISGSGTRNDSNNFGPRIGLAYRIGGKTVFRAGYGIFYSFPLLDITRNLASNPPEFVAWSFTNNQFDFTGARAASSGFERPAAGVATGAPLNAISATDPTPSIQQWNAALQRELPRSLSLTVAYVGTKGTHLESRYNLNAPVPGVTPVAARQPYPQFQAINISSNRDDSIYHGLQVSGERRFGQGLAMLLAYTYSHAIDINSGDFQSPMDVRNFRLDRANADFDVRHRFSASASYALPFRSGHRVLRHAVQSWQINGILSLYGGLPFSVSSATNTLNTGGATRADRLCSGSLPGDRRTLQRWFDTSCFTTPGPQLFGNGGRNILRGPGTRQLDFSLFKDFILNPDATRRLQLRAEAFNLTNTPQFNNPASTVGNANAGTVTSAGSTLTLQRTPRQVQLALKLYF